MSNLVTRCRLSCQARLRSFLKNHRAHLGEGMAKRKQRAPMPTPSSTQLAGKSHPFQEKLEDGIWGTGPSRCLGRISGGI